MILMKTLFNKKIILPLLIIIIFAMIGILIFKKTRQIEKNKLFYQELIVDNVSDPRALGYSGQRKITQNSKGDIFLGYRKDYHKNSEIFVAKIYQDITGWHITDTEKPIATVGKNDDQRVPSLAIDSKDTIHTVWYGSSTEEKNNRQIKYSRKPSEAEKWESWRDIAYVSGHTDDEFWQEHPMILTGENDVLYIVWEGKDEENDKQQIKFIKSENRGTVWTKWKNISPSKNSTHSRPTLVEDKTGKLFIFAYSSLGNEDNLQQIQYATSSDKGETWSAWQTISDPNFDARHISTAIDEIGRIYVAWRAQTEYDGPTQILYRTIFENHWSKSKPVFPSQNYQFFPNVGTHQSGEVFISWIENLNPSEFPKENPTGGLGLISFLKNKTFQTPIEISKQNNLLYPNLSEKNNIPDFVPVFHMKQLNDKEFQLKLKFLKINKQPIDLFRHKFTDTKKQFIDFLKANYSRLLFN